MITKEQREEFAARRTAIDAQIFELLAKSKTVADLASLGFSRNVARKALARLESSGAVAHEQLPTGGSLEGAVGGWENHYSRVDPKKRRK
jgi:predicted transcriptional regulator